MKLSFGCLLNICDRRSNLLARTRKLLQIVIFKAPDCLKKKRLKVKNNGIGDGSGSIKFKVSRGWGMEKAMAPHSSALAWKIPWTEEPGGLQSMGSHRVGHDWATSLSLFIFMHWRRKWQPTPVLLLGESQGRGWLVACRLWGRTESDTTEAT